MRVQTAFRLREKLVQRLKESADRNFRNLTQEVEMRLEQSLEQNPAGVGTPPGVVRPDEEVLNNEQNTTTDA